MTLSSFLELVEIKTKIASLFPFLVALAYCAYYYQSFNWINTGLFFVAMLSFDMATTVMNNTMDYIKAKNLTYKKEENVLGRDGISVRLAFSILIGMVTLSALIGLVLVYRTNLLLLLVGLACFFIGLFYTFGPIPISRMPLGEILSGFTMGLGIFGIMVYINVPIETTAAIFYHNGILTGAVDLVFLAKVFLQALPLVCTIANIMLSNNICDLETDISNHRYTLVYYITKERALLLYQWLYYTAFLAITLAVLLRISPWLMLATWLLFPMIQKNIKTFQAKQEKSTTFVLAIKNLVLLHSLQIILLLVATVIGKG
ncbi:1,4-dihydroxy-2-naphthoate polyprenyltransferase [Granulicatella seriolae]|uniref:1,4-dihydroxy-2-naphthoate polyprenyltransferase n=1 Tax=Granulicatella seriolae TaxID=2967226 RepID=A0ABT1WP12_9LACT|nr:1,4-dihydroxy-2-naphthoate polyprenyltransferase [Granulicatella seriolae]